MVDDPENEWVDRLGLRRARASNEARQRTFLRLAARVQRLIAQKALALAANAVAGCVRSARRPREHVVLSRLLTRPHLIYTVLEMLSTLSCVCLILVLCARCAQVPRLVRSRGRERRRRARARHCAATSARARRRLRAARCGAVCFSLAPSRLLRSSSVVHLVRVSMLRAASRRSTPSASSMRRWHRSSSSGRCRRASRRRSPSPFRTSASNARRPPRRATCRVSLVLYARAVQTMAREPRVAL